MTAHIAELTPMSVRIWTSDDRPELVVTMRLPDHGSPDDVLRAYGWHRVTAWARSDDMPDDHRLATVVPA